jgi:hypothetical protein
MKWLIPVAAALLIFSACAKPEPAAAPKAADAPPVYRPSMGDLMILAIQPRHEKLGAAGQAGDWKYAGYEASELRHAFDRIAKAIPTYHEGDFASMAAANMKDPLDKLDTAIKAKDSHGFTAAFGQLTQGCNACHQSLNHGDVVIRPPAGLAFPDQDFRPAPAG